MKKLFSKFFMLWLPVILLSVVSAQAQWTTVGSTGFSPGQSFFNSIAIDKNNNKYVAFRDNANSYKATVMKYNGSSWSVLGAAGFSAGTANEIDIAIDTNGVVYVAYQDYANNRSATVMKFDGTNWVTVGVAGFTLANASYISLEVDKNNVPHLAYRENYQFVTVMKFNGTSWTTVGSANFGASGQSNFVNLAFDNNNVPYVVYRDNTGFQATSMKFNGTNWVLAGNRRFSAGRADYTDIAFDGNGDAYVTFSDGANSNKATVMKYDGTSWTIVGTAGFSTGAVKDNKIAIDGNGTPYVVYKDGADNDKGVVMSYNGSSWVKLGGTGFSDSTITYYGTADITIGDNNKVYVAYADLPNSSKTTVKVHSAQSVSVPATAINFERNDDRIDIGNLLATNSSYTKEAWVYLETNPNDEKNIISSSKAPFYVTKAGYLRAENSFSGGTAVQDPNLLSLNQWVHVAATYDAASATMKLYKNGTLVATNTSAIGHAAGNIAIGSFGNANTWDGSIDEVRLWNRALSQCEIQNNMNCELNPAGQTGLVALYHFNQGFVNANNSTVTTAIDASGNGNNGTLVNFALTGTASNWTTGVVSGTCSAFTPIATTVTPSGATTFCTGDSVTLTASAGTGYTYQWQLNGSNISGATNASYTASAAGNYTVVVSANGCSATSTPTVVTVNAIPTAAITASGTTTFCTGGSVTLSASSASSYQWQIGGMDISSATNNSYSTGNSGNYSVKVTDANGCSATSSVTTVTEKGVWTPAGCPGISTSTAHTTSLAVDTNGIVYAAYTDASQSNKTTVQQYDGNSWSIVGTAGFSSAGQSQSLAVGPDNMLYMAVEEFGIGATVYKYNGSSWITVGSAGFSPGAVNHTSLAIDGSGVLYVAFKDNANGGKTSVMKYNGTSWVHVGATGISTGNAVSQQIVIDNNDVPHVVYADNNTARKLQVYKFDGTSWVSVGGPNISSGPAVSPTIAFDANNTLFAAYKDGYPQGPATVLKYNGSSWVTVGNSGFSQGYMDYITLAFDSQNKLIASYRDDANNLSITTQRYDNGVWTPIGAQGITTNTANQGSFVIDSDDNMYVAFRDFNSGSRLTVMKTGPSPVTTIAANGPTDICSGNSVQLSVSACNGSSYQWMKNGTTISGANSATYDATTSGTYTVSITSNGCSSVSDSININVKQATTITACASDIILNASGNCNATATYSVTATGASTPTLSYVFSGATSGSGNGTGSGSTFNTGVTNVMVIASDSCGNDTCSFTVTVNDVTPPTITCPSNISVNADNGACSTSVSIPQPTVTDNCQAVGNALDFDGSNDYVQMANSISLNSYVSTGELTIEFWVKPTNVSGDNTIIAHRNNGNSQGLVFEMIGSNKLACYVRAGGWRAIALYLTPNTWQHVAVVADATSGIKGYINGVLMTSKSFNAGFTQSNDVWRIGRNSQSSYPRYFKGGLDEMRIWNTARSESDLRATMNMELSGSESGLVGYYDMNQGTAGGNNSSPAVNILTDKTSNGNNGSLSNFSLNGSTSNWVQGAGAINNIVLTNNANASSNASGTYNVGTTTVEWVATDLSGNKDTCYQTVTVVDNQNPTITCSANVTVNADAGQCSAANVSLGNPTTADNCGVASTTNNAPSSYSVGTTTVTWTVTDVNGNTATCTQDVTVVDNQSPTITAPANVTVNADAGQCSATNVALGTPTTGDNCGIASTTSNAPSSYPVGTTNVVWTVIDVNGNSSTATQTVTVVDNQNPTIACPANVTVNADNGICAATNVSLGTPTTGDNCGVASTTNNAPSSYPVGTTTVTWTVTDVNGNSATATQTVTVVDNQLPIVATQNQTIYLNTSGSAAITTTDINNGSYDNCGIDNMSLNKTSFGCSDVGSNTVTLTVTDIHSNSATGTATITVVDTVKPVITCPANVTVSCLTITANTGVATATDACGIDTITYAETSTYSSNPADATHYNYTITRVWTATDVNDNSSNSCTQTITVQQLRLAASVSNVLCNGGNTGSINLTTTGGVGNLTYSWSNNATTEDVSGLAAGTYTVTVTDSAGCTATATYTVTEPTMLTLTAVSVSPNPTVSGQSMNTIYLGYGAQSVTLSSTASGGTPGYSYSWSPTTGVANPTSATTSVSPTVTTTYTLTVTDENGCTKSVSKTIYVMDIRYGNNKVIICHKGRTKKVSVNAVQAHLNHGDQLGECFKLQANTSKVSCYGGSNGSIDVTVKGGIPPFSYSWNTNATTEDLTGLSAGNYTLTVTAANNEVTSRTFKVEQYSKININEYVKDVTCYGDNNGKIYLNTYGGRPNYSYLWNDNSTSKHRYNLSAGSYAVTVTDNNGCTMTDSFTVAQPTSPLSVSGTVANVNCDNSYSGSIDISVAGGTGPYTYYWSKNNYYWSWSWYWWWNNKCNKQDLSSISAGTYKVVVKDRNGCTVTKTFTVAPANKPNVNITVSPNPTVSGQAPYTIFKGYGPQSVTLTANVSGGTSPYTYSWTPTNSLSGSSTSSTTASPNNTTKYYLKVTDDEGCSETVSRRIYVQNVQWYGEKVRICHNGQNKKVSYNSVAAHLAHGDRLGYCQSQCKGCPDPGAEDDEINDGEAKGLAALDHNGLLNNDGALRVYPNPNNGTFSVELPESVKGGQVLFRDMAGKVIKTLTFMPDAQLKFSMPEVADGMYMLEVINNDEIYRARMIIKR